MMGQSKYRIFELSARAVMSYAAQENGQWHFALDRAATEKVQAGFRPSRAGRQRAVLSDHVRRAGR